MHTVDQELWDAAPAASCARARWASNVLPSLRASLATLKVRLTLAFIAALACGIGVVSALSAAKTERDLRSQAESREMAEAAHVASDLSSRVVAIQNTLRLTAEAIDPVLESMDDGLEQFINGQPAVRSIFANLFVADPSGRMRLLVDDVGVHRPSVSLADREYFRRLIAERRPIVSNQVPGRVSGEPVVVFCHPIVRDGKVTSVIGGAIRLRSRSFTSSLSAQRHGGDDAQAMAVTYGAALLLEHPDTALLGHSLLEDDGFRDAVLDWQRQGSPLEPSGVSVHQAGRIVSVAGVAGTDWAVWRALPESTLFAPLHAARRDVVRDAVVVITVLSVLSLLLIYALLRPLGQLERRAQRLFEPDDQHREGWPDERGEVGQVVRALRHVAAERAQLERFTGDLLGRLSSVMAAAPLGIAFTRHQRFELVSRAWCQLLQMDEGELVGAAASTAFASLADYQALGAFVADAFATQGRYEGEWTFVRKDGSHFWGLLSGQPVEHGKPAAGTIWTLADVTFTRQTRESLEWSATHDPLTGLLNRKGFERRLAAAATRGEAVLIAIDLDKFKPINDTHGHAAGDAVLKAVAEGISSRIRSNDAAIRVGGDEFAIVLERCPLENGKRVAHAVLEAIASIRVPWGSATLHVGASLGVAGWSDRFADSHAWVQAADAACYEAKAAGRGAVRVSQANG